MKVINLKLGDRIKLKQDWDGSPIEGKEGRICLLPTSGTESRFGIELDESFYGGHNLNGFLEQDSARGFYVPEKIIELIDFDWDK
jgi:hypothetical protein